MPLAGWYVQLTPLGITIHHGVARAVPPPIDSALAAVGGGVPVAPAVPSAAKPRGGDVNSRAPPRLPMSSQHVNCSSDCPSTTAFASVSMFSTTSAEVLWFPRPVRGSANGCAWGDGCW